MSGDWNRESVTCPACGESWADLWDYEWGNREEIHTECPHCAAALVLQRDVSVRYRVVRDKENVA